MKWQPGNALWRLADPDTVGAPPIFETPQELIDACRAYFDWVRDTPLYETRPMKNARGDIEMVQVPRMRAMSVAGLCSHLGFAARSWRHWRAERDDLKPVIEIVEQVMRAQKFEGASADLLNANIIARDLGLAERNVHQDPDGKPAGVSVVQQLADQLERLAKPG